MIKQNYQQKVLSCRAWGLLRLSAFLLRSWRAWAAPWLSGGENVKKGGDEGQGVEERFVADGGRRVYYCA